MTSSDVSSLYQSMLANGSFTLEQQDAMLESMREELEDTADTRRPTFIPNGTNSSVLPSVYQSMLRNGSITEEKYEAYMEYLREALENATANANAQPAAVYYDNTRGGELDVIIGVAVGTIATIVLFAAGFLYYRRQINSNKRRQQKESPVEEPTTTAVSSTANYSNLMTSSSSSPMDTQAFPPSTAQYTCAALWENDSLLAVRVSFDAITRLQLISQGGFGEVYRGRFRDQEVAIKTLLPAKRKDMAQIRAFLAEIQFIAALDHARIVTFVGVAWESLSDVCLVTEFMAGGDLRSLLTSFESSQPPRAHGFDQDKIKIALHVAHALTYLHSLQPVVVHRDLKSRNILLDLDGNAKLTDFGISRERVDATMTAGIGSSLWIAPEVMLGERYDEKADIFSFGVVLSELDTQQLPYAHAKETGGSGRTITQTAMLQLVSLGRLTVSLTETSQFPEIQELVRKCVALDPSDRPTAGEVLHCVHQASRHAGLSFQGGGGLV